MDQDHDLNWPTPESGCASLPYLSKSKFLWGLQCSKLLWHAYNAKDKIPAPDAQAKAVFDQGHEVGSLAKKLFSEGIEVALGVTDLDETLRLTADAIKLRKPLFEAAFAAESGYCRVDILVPSGLDEWDIVEVKSTTSVKDVHLHDLAFQCWVLNRAGLRIRACHLMHINCQYVRQGAVDPAKFFSIRDVSAQTQGLFQGVEDAVSGQFATILRSECPDIKVGPQCDNPYVCPLHDQCWSFLPPDNISTLYRGRKKAFNLMAEGILGIKDIPDGYPLTEIQEIQRSVAISRQPHISVTAIKDFLGQINYPASFLDFETLATAIPLFDGTRPYEQVPFQFSLHIVGSPGGEPEHHKFLADGQTDPRRDFLQRLSDALPDSGSIVAYNARFELSRMRECCQFYPDFQPWLTRTAPRMVDLLKPFRAFNYYAPSQNGSAGMKAVLPALTGRSYDHLAIQDGGAASMEFLRVHFTDVLETERDQVRRDLEAYCRLDTEGMIWIVDALRRLAAQ